MVGEEHTIVGPYVRVPLESPKGVHLLDRRVIRWLYTVSAPSASCMITGLLCQSRTVVRMCRLSPSLAATIPISRMSTSRRIRVSAEGFQASFKVGMGKLGVRGSTWRGRREHQRRFQVVVVGEVNSLSHAPRRKPGDRGRRVPVEGVLLLVALPPRRRPDDEDQEQLLFVDGTTRLAGRNPVSHPPREPPFDFQ